jgi:hypothetical protein
VFELAGNGVFSVRITLFGYYDVCRSAPTDQEVPDPRPTSVQLSVQISPDGAFLQRLMTRVAHILGAAAIVLVALVTGAQPALGTYIVSRDVVAPVLQVDRAGHALVTFEDKGKVRRLLVYGAINALPPTPGGRQVAFTVDYSGGWKALKTPDYYKKIKNVCSAARYDGPVLPFKVFACKATDGSYWALQRWQRMLPDLGFTPWRPEQAAQELHVSHWKGPLPELNVTMDWAWGNRYEQIIGTYSYAGKPVYGFRSTSSGIPLDGWGRNIYLDTFDSAYGAGWKRENSFLAQSTNGRFCYSLGPRPPYPGYPASPPRQGAGERYRLVAQGPGVTPIVSAEIPAIGPFDPNDSAKVQAEADGNALVRSLGFTRKQCHS